VYLDALERVKAESLGVRIGEWVEAIETSLSQYGDESLLEWWEYWKFELPTARVMYGGKYIPDITLEKMRTNNAEYFRRYEEAHRNFLKIKAGLA